MHIINKEYFVIHIGKKILMSGKRDGQFVTCLVEYAEFDTEEDMIAYITDNELIQEPTDA